MSKNNKLQQVIQEEFVKLMAELNQGVLKERIRHVPGTGPSRPGISQELPPEPAGAGAPDYGTHPDERVRNLAALGMDPGTIEANLANVDAYATKMPRRVAGMSTKYLLKRGYEWDPAKGTMMKGGRSVQDRQAAYKAGRTGAPATPAAAATAKPGEDYDALVAQQKDPVDYEAGTGFDSLEAQYPTDTTDVARARGLTSTDPVKGTAGDADEQIWSVDADTSLMSPAGYRSGEQSVLEPESAFRGRELQKSLPEDPGSAGYGQSIDPRSKPDKEDLVADEPFRFDRELRESKLNKVIMEEFTNLLNELAKKRI